MTNFNFDLNFELLDLGAVNEGYSRSRSMIELGSWRTLFMQICSTKQFILLVFIVLFVDVSINLLFVQLTNKP